MEKLLVLLLFAAAAVVVVVDAFPKGSISANPSPIERLKLKGHSYSCYFDWDCKGGYCCSTVPQGCIGYCIPCARSLEPEAPSTKCVEDFDCEGGFCCSAIQPGLEGDCVPCGGGKEADVDPSPKCFYDFDCPGGYCCSETTPGLGGECVVCGGGNEAAKVEQVEEAEAKDYCKYDSDCPEGYCCDLYYPFVGECKPCEGAKRPQGKAALPAKVDKAAHPSPKCQYDADCPGGYCCYQDIPGLDGQCVVCGNEDKEPAQLQEENEYCKYDSDCEEGFCCDWYYPNVGECKPCTKKDQEVIMKIKEQPSPKCQYDSDCMGGYCCSQEIPGLDGECVVCGRKPEPRAASNDGCYSHMECPGTLDCCWQESVTQAGTCVPCCL